MPLNARKNESRIFYQGKRKNAANGLKMPLKRKPRYKPRKPNAKKDGKRAQSVPKTDETEQRNGKTNGNTAQPSNNPPRTAQRWRRVSSSTTWQGCQAILLDRGKNAVIRFYYLYIKLYTKKRNIIYYAELFIHFATVILYTGRKHFTICTDKHARRTHTNERRRTG